MLRKTPKSTTTPSAAFIGRAAMLFKSQSPSGIPKRAERTSRCEISRAFIARDSIHWAAQLTVDTAVAVTTAVGRSTKKIIKGTEIKPKPKPKRA